MPLSRITFDEFCELLIPLGSLNSPSDLHGFVCGKLCGGARLSRDQCLQQVWDLLDVAAARDAACDEHILTLYDNALDELSSGDYCLQLLLPDADADIAERTQALGQWVQSFLLGFGASGIDPQTKFSSDHAEALRDLAQIAQVSYDDSDAGRGDGQESAYFELTEYVRMVALTFYAEHNIADSRPHPQSLP